MPRKKGCLGPADAERFARELLSDLSHNIGSAAMAVGLHPNTVRDAIRRFDQDTCRSEIDYETCAILARAKSEHVRELRRRGDTSAEGSNGPGVSHWKWRCEIQDPINHPRPSQKLEHSGPDGAPIQQETRTVLILPDNGRLLGEGGSSDDSTGD